MATWQESNGAGFLAGIGTNNDNAPRAGDNNASLELILQNNDLQRSGANNIGLQALQGLNGLASIYQQDQQQKAIGAFNNAHAQAWKTGDTAILRDFAAANPAFVSYAQQAVSGLDAQQKNEMGSLATGVNTALAQGPEAFSKFISSNSDRLKRVGADPNWMIQAGVQNPEQLSHLASTLALGAVGPEKMFDVKDKMVGRQQDQQRINETVRSNQAGEALTARGQNISASNARLAANGPTSAMQNYEMYSRLLRQNPEEAAIFAQSAGIKTGPTVDNRQVQLSDGRTVNVGGKLHGAGANAFYEGIDDQGNMVRVPANAIAAPPTSAASAQNYAMKKDIDSILNSSPNQLNFMTGVTGGVGEPALFTEQRSRVRSLEERNLYTATRRIQGKMQNQGIAAARDMGASGINTVAEAKMYFQGMPQIDYSSPEAMQSSLREIQQYTDNYNQQYNVNIGTSTARPAASPVAPVSGGGYSSLWGG